MKKLHNIFILVVIVLGVSCDKTFACDSVDEAREIINAFCKIEFNGGDDARLKYSKFSKEYNKSLRATGKGNQYYGELVYLAGDPLYIVDSFTIQNIDIQYSKAIAMVRFKMLARTEEYGDEKRKIIPEYKENDIVRYELERIGGSWFVVDPPLPRVSQKALIEYYKALILSMGGDNWLIRNDVKESQKNYYLKLKGDFEIIQKLIKNKI